MTREVIGGDHSLPYRRGMAMVIDTPTVPTFGVLLREWRERRRLSQLALALEAEVSTRHLSFLETGKARPSREMVLRLAERLEAPLRERNTLLLAAGFSPAYAERGLEDPALSLARAVVDRVLAGHEPYPALAIDRGWNLIAANRVVPALLTVVSPALLQPPINVLRLSLHPEGLAPRIANLPQWRAHLLARLGHEAEVTADPRLEALLAELRSYPGDGPNETNAASGSMPGLAGVAVPMRLTTEGGTLSFLSTTMVFGTAVDVTLSELAIEAFFPADAATAEALRRLAPAADRQRTE